jgi:hypothetical protein
MMCVMSHAQTVDAIYPQPSSENDNAAVHVGLSRGLGTPTVVYKQTDCGPESQRFGNRKTAQKTKVQITLMYSCDITTGPTTPE